MAMGAIRTEVLDKLKMEDTTYDQARVLGWINLAYFQAVQETGCLQTCGVTLLTGGEGGYSLPSNVEWLKAVHYTYADGTLSVPMEKVNLDEMLRLRRQGVSTGERVMQPAYTLLGQSRIELWPTPATGSTLKFWYVYLPPALVAPADTPLIREPYGSKLLELGACVEGAKFKKDPLLQSYQQEHEAWLTKFQGWLNKRQSGIGGSMEVIVDSYQPSLQLVRNL